MKSKSPKVSIVMPCYNVGAYVGSAIASAIDQTLIDIEIIPVNDGSTDNTGEIIDSYAQTDTRVKPIHQVNGGYGRAVNAGVKASTGDYIAIFESDDIIARDMYNDLYSSALTSGADIIKSNGYYEYKDGFPVLKNLFSQNLNHLENNIDSICGKVWLRHPTIWNAIYKREYIENNNIRMPESPGASFQDVNFLVTLYSTASSVHLIGRTYYYYRIHENQSVALADKLVSYIEENWKSCIDDLRSRGQLEIHKDFVSLIFFRQLETLCKVRLKDENNKIYLTSILRQLLTSIPDSNHLSHPLASKTDRENYTRLVEGSNFWLDKHKEPKKTYNYLKKIGKKNVVFINKMRFIFPKNIILWIKNKFYKIIIKHNQASGIKSLEEEVSFLRSYIFDSHFLGDDRAQSTSDENIDMSWVTASKRPVLVFNSADITNYGLAYAHVLFPSGVLQPGYLKRNRQVADSFLFWGQFRNKLRSNTLMEATLSNTRCAFMDEGFIKSITPQVDRKCHIKYRSCLAFQFDTNTTYYDSSRPSILEKLLNSKKQLSTKEISRAQNLMRAIVNNYISKYNHQPIFKPSYGRPERRKVLVLDQAYNDWSIIKGGVSESVFLDMLSAARLENPDADIIIKTHPDMIGDSKRGGGNGSGYYAGLSTHDNIFIVKDLINPIALLQEVDTVYVCSSQMGFEAAMCGKKVVVFGMPFYAGWGLTDDRNKSNHMSRRKRKRTLAEIFHFAYIEYSYYIDPVSMRPCDLERHLENIMRLRQSYFDENKVRFDQEFDTNEVLAGSPSKESSLEEQVIA